MKRNIATSLLFLLLTGVLMLQPAAAQTTTPATGTTTTTTSSAAAVTPAATATSALPTTFVGGGIAGSPGATPPVVGTALFATQLSAASGTYSATICQAIPNNTKPFTVTTNCGTGVAQKAPFTIGSLQPYLIVDGGISWQSSNVGFQWSGMGTIPFRVKQSNWYVLPFVGWSKSSVSNGTGYQLTAGTIVSWGK